jgi:hypothetical protein
VPPSHSTNASAGSTLTSVIAAITFAEIILVAVAFLASLGVFVGAIALGVRLGTTSRRR